MQNNRSNRRNRNNKKQFNKYNEIFALRAELEKIKSTLRDITNSMKNYMKNQKDKTTVEQANACTNVPELEQVQ